MPHCRPRQRWVWPSTRQARLPAECEPVMCWPPWILTGGISHALPDQPPSDGVGAHRDSPEAVARTGAGRCGDRVALGCAGLAYHGAATADHGRRQRGVHHPVAGAVRVLPLVIPTRILDEANVIVALTLYTTALLVREVFEALDAVPLQVRDAATAVGYRPIGRLLKVELPLSIPVLVAGLRVVVVTNISMVSVGAVIGIGGLGTWFTEGYQANKSDQIVAGILAIFVL